MFLRVLSGVPGLYEERDNGMCRVDREPSMTRLWSISRAVGQTSDCDAPTPLAHEPPGLTSLGPSADELLDPSTPPSVPPSPTSVRREVHGAPPSPGLHVNEPAPSASTASHVWSVTMGIPSPQALAPPSNETHPWTMTSQLPWSSLIGRHTPPFPRTGGGPVQRPQLQVRSQEERRSQEEGVNDGSPSAPAFEIWMGEVHVEL